MAFPRLNDLRLKLLGHEEALVLEGGHGELHAHLGVLEVVRGYAHGPQGEPAGAHNKDLADAFFTALPQDVLHVLVGVEHRVHGEQGARGQHGGYRKRHRVRDLDEELQVVDNDELSVAVNNNSTSKLVSRWSGVGETFRTEPARGRLH